MELHPFFERISTPQNNLWYVLATDGDPPSMRVGSTATFIAGKSEEEEGRLYVIGGANPDGTFAEINLLDLTTMTWDRLDTPSHISRYEHAVSTYPDGNGESSPSIFIFGGAVQTKNLNDIQRYSIGDENWSSVVARGTPPSSRTQHSMSAFFSDGRLVVFGGGAAGADPVGDRHTYVFDPSSSSWSVMPLSGQPPKARHGHLILACSGNGSAGNGEKVYVHGGMTGRNFYDDLYMLDLARNQWSELQVDQQRPLGRAAHGGVVWKEKLYIFGGMCTQGALDDMWSFDTGTKTWTEIKYDGPPPPSRLDFACCLLSLRTRSTEDGSQFDGKIYEGATRVTMENGTKESVDTGTSDSKGDESATGLSVSTSRSIATMNEGTEKAEMELSRPNERSIFFLVSGGMDTQGNIFDDTLIFMIDREPLAECNVSLEDKIEDKMREGAAN